MSEEIKNSEYTQNKSKTTWEKRVENADGSYEETCVEQVSNGFIKTVRKVESGEDYKCDVVKSIHTENPMEDMSLADKLERFLKDN